MVQLMFVHDKSTVQKGAVGSTRFKTPRPWLEIFYLIYDSHV